MAGLEMLETTPRLASSTVQISTVADSLFGRKPEEIELWGPKDPMVPRQRASRIWDSSILLRHGVYPTPSVDARGGIQMMRNGCLLLLIRQDESCVLCRSSCYLPVVEDHRWCLGKMFFARSAVASTGGEKPLSLPLTRRCITKRRPADSAGWDQACGRQLAQASSLVPPSPEQIARGRGKR